MEPPAGKKFSLRERGRSFRYAMSGIADLVKHQHNFRIHLAVFIIVVLAGFLLDISATEWCVVLLASALVFSMEALNSAIEAVVDLLSPGYSKTAGKAKDLGAAAVLISAVFAVVCGTIIFGGHLLLIFFP